MQQTQDRVRAPSPAARSLAALACPSGAFAMLAIDQREALRAMLAKHATEPVSDQAVTDFKLAVTRALSPHASAILLDKQFVWDQAVESRAVAPSCAHKRGFWGGVQAAASAGILLATGIFALLGGLSKAQFLEWGWRIPFLVSALFTVVGLFIRVSLMETSEFQKLMLKANPSALRLASCSTTIWATRCWPRAHAWPRRSPPTSSMPSA